MWFIFLFVFCFGLCREVSVMIKTLPITAHMRFHCCLSRSSLSRRKARVWLVPLFWLGWSSMWSGCTNDQEDLHSDFLEWFVFSLAWALPADGRYLLAGAEVTCLSFTFFVGLLLALLSHLLDTYLLTCLQLNLFNWGRSSVLHGSLELTQNTGEIWLRKSALKA